MRKIIAMAAGLALFTAGAAWANSCPKEMKAIDDKLATKPAVSKDVLDQVAKLRAEGEVHHKAGKHADSMKVLGDAKKLLGI